MFNIPAKSRVSSILLVASLLVLVSCGTGSQPAPTVTPIPTQGATMVPATPPATPASTPLPATPVSSPMATPVLGPTPTPVFPVPSPVSFIPDTPEQNLAAEFLENEPGVYGFVVLEADGTPVVSINSKTPFVTASLYKLILMADIYQRIEAGTLSLDDTLVLESRVYLEALDNYFSPGQIGTAVTIREYLLAVGAWSSNVAARMLMTQTSPGAMRNVALSIGMTDTYLFVSLDDVPNWPPPREVDAPLAEWEVAIAYLEESAASGPINLTTPLDMARYQLAIANDTLISPWVSEQVAGVLGRQAIRDRIPARLDGQVFIINKPGNLVDAVNDVGVLYLPAGHRSLAILSQAIPNWERATVVEQYLAVIATGWVEYVPSAIWIREVA